jgi:plasmid stabilization system protein ParE
MALDIVWTPRALSGYYNIVNYLREKWTEREVRNFVRRTSDFFELLSEYPEMLPKTGRHKNVHRGPMTKYTLVTYRVQPKKKQIEVINIRSTRQKPLP